MTLFIIIIPNMVLIINKYYNKNPCKQSAKLVYIILVTNNSSICSKIHKTFTKLNRKCKLIISAKLIW